MTGSGWIDGSTPRMTAGALIASLQCSGRFAEYAGWHFHANALTSFLNRW
jgi:hypothetical protein